MKAIRFALILVTAGFGLLTGVGAPLAQEEARLPRPRPLLASEEQPPSPEQPTPLAEAYLVAGPAIEDGVHEADVPDAASAIDMLARVPRARPEATPTLALVAPSETVEEPQAPPGPRITEGDEEYSACLTRLRSLGVVFAEEEPIKPGTACGVDHPLNVASIGSGISITPEAILNCQTTEALARWAQDVMRPAADEYLNAAPVEIVHGSAYVCRPRNNQAGARLSEHATANAFDISSIRFANREAVDVGVSASRAERKFQTAVRQGSCEYFTTVLGPGSNAAHATHFHFDMAQRRGGHRLCDMGGQTMVGR